MFCIWFIPCIAEPPLSLAILFIWFIILFMLVFISPYPPPQLFAVGPIGPPTCPHFGCRSHIEDCSWQPFQQPFEPACPW